MQVDSQTTCILLNISIVFLALLLIILIWRSGKISNDLIELKYLLFEELEKYSLNLKGKIDIWLLQYLMEKHFLGNIKFIVLLLHDFID